MSDEESGTFIREWIRLNEDNKNFDAVMRMYADEVDFYGHGAVNKSFIAADKRKYFGRWPLRKHRIISVAFHPGGQDNEKRAEVLFHYKIRKGRKVLEGDAQTLVLLRKIQDRIFIFGEKDLTVPAASAGAGAEYLVWSGNGGTEWIDARGNVLRRSKENVPLSVLNDALYSARTETQTVMRADCSDERFLEDPGIKPTLKKVPGRRLSISALKDGQERNTILLAPEDNDAGEGETDIEILGAIGPLLFIERSVYSYVCGGPHGADAEELLIVDVETLKTVPAYPGQEKYEVEKSILGEKPKSAVSPVTLFSGTEYRTLMNALTGKATKDIGDIEEAGDLRVTRIRPVVERDTMGLEVLLTAPTGYAGSDGEWSSYTRSRAYLSPVMPGLIKPYRGIPPPVLTWWKANKRKNYPSWSEVPPAGPVRRQLEKLF